MRLWTKIMIKKEQPEIVQSIFSLIWFFIEAYKKKHLKRKIIHGSRNPKLNLKTCPKLVL